MSHWMRRCVAALIIAAGAAGLIALRMSDNEEACESQPSFMLRGTYADCAVRSGPPPVTPDSGVAIVATRLE